MADEILEEDLPVRIDGEVVVFKKGMTHSEIRDEYQSITGGFFPGLSAGFERLKGSVGAIPDILLGDLLSSQEDIDQAGKEYEASRKSVSEALPSPVTYKDVKEEYDRSGLLGAVPDAYRFSAEAIGQTIPYTLPSLFAGKVASSSAGLGVASYIAKAVPFLRTASVAVPPSVLKFGLGAAAGIGTLALQFFGDNMQRQYETAELENDGEKRVTPDQLNSFSAALAAAPQAGMDYIVIALSGGIGRGPQIAAARSLQQSLGAVGSTAKASAFPTLGQAARASFAESAIEFPTEMLQTILERAQAGLSISPSDVEFVEEMIATVAGTLPVAGAFGSYGTARSHLANKRAYDSWGKLSEEEKLVRNEAEGRRSQSLQSEYDRSIDIYQRNLTDLEESLKTKEAEAEGNRAEIEARVQEAKDNSPINVEDVIDAAISRNILSNDDAFKAFVYRSTGGKTNDINSDKVTEDELRAMRTIISGFTIQKYFDPGEESGVSFPLFTSEEFETVVNGFKVNGRINNETVRKKLHERFFAKARESGEAIDYTDSESSNRIAEALIDEMKLRGYAAENKKGNLVARKPKYTESQYRSLIEKAYTDGSINKSDYEKVTNRFNQADFDSFIEDAKTRGDLPQKQPKGVPDGEYYPLVFRAVLDEGPEARVSGEIKPKVTKSGKPVIRPNAIDKRKVKSRITTGNVITEVVESDGYFVLDENNEIVGGASTKKGAEDEANFLERNRARYKIVDRESGNPVIGTKNQLNKLIEDSKGIPEYMRRSARAPDYRGETPEFQEGKFRISKDKSVGFAVRQYVSPVRNIKDKGTGKPKQVEGDFGPRRSNVTELSFAPDLNTAESLKYEFAKDSMPGASDWDKANQRAGEQARLDLEETFDRQEKIFRPPQDADISSQLQEPQRPTRISKREKVLKAIPEGSVAKGKEVLKVIESKLKEANLSKAVIGSVMEKIERGNDIAEGSYSPNDDGFRRIAISLDQIKGTKTLEEMRVAVASIMDHEIIHAMRDLDLFTVQEWNVLSTSTYRVRDRNGNTFFEAASTAYPEKNTEYILEEAVAEMYRQYYSVPEVRRQIAGQPRTLIERMAIFMEKLYNAMQGAGFVTAADAISGMKKIQAREAGEVRTIQRDRNALISSAIEVEEVEEEVAGQAVAESVISDTEADPGVRVELGRDPVDANADIRTGPIEAERFSAAFSEGNVPETILADKIDVSGMKKLPGGTTRDVYVIGNRVLKVARNPRGLEQNQSMGFGDKGIVGSALPEMFEAGKDYVVTENVPRNDKETRRFLKPLKDFSPKDFEYKTPALQEAMDEMGLDGFLNYDLLWNDFTAFRNWGQRANGEFVLVDEGALNKSITSTSKPAEWAVADWADIKTRRRQAKTKLRGAFYVQKANGRNVEVVKNPNSSDQRQISKEFRGEWPNAPRGEPSTRVTYDSDGNTYIWRSDLGNHSDIEPLISTEIGFPVNQNKSLIDQGRVVERLSAVLSGQPEEALGNFSEDRLSRIIKRQTPYDADVITDSPSAFEAKFEVPSENDMPPVGFFFTAIGADQGKGNWDISFRDDTGRHDRTGKLGALRASKVFKTIYDLTDALMKEKSPSSFTLTAAVEITPNRNLKRTRQLLYSSVLKDLAYENGYEITETKTNGDSFFSGKKGEYKHNLIDQSKPLVQLPFDPDDPLGVSEDNQRASEAITRRQEEQEAERLSAVPGLDAGRSAMPNQGSAKNQWKIPRLKEVDERASLVSKRARGIAEGSIEPQRLSVANKQRVKKTEAPASREIKQLRGMFPVRKDESFFQSIMNALKDPDKKQLSYWLKNMRRLYINQYDRLFDIDQIAALKRGDNRDIRASTSAASLALLSDRANNIVSAAINHGALIFRGGIARVDRSKKSLKQALDPLFRSNDDLYRDWGMWMVAGRSGRLIKDGKLTAITDSEIEIINEDIRKRGLLPMFEKVKRDYEEWNDSVVSFMEDTGIINDELAVVFKKYSDYIPFYRNMDMDGEGEDGVSPQVFKQILKAEGVDLSLGVNRKTHALFPTLTDQKPPKKLKGGDQQMVDPLTGIMQNLRAAVIAGTRNVAAQRVKENAIDAGMATEVFADEDGNVTGDVFTVREKGVEKYFITDDRLLIDTLVGFTQGKVGVHPFFAIPAKVLREAVSRSPLFIFRNQFRDSLSVWSTSGVEMTPIVETMKKFSDTLRGEEKSKQTYDILEDSGIVSKYDEIFDPKKFERSFRNRMRKEGMTTKKGSGDHVLNVFSKMWETLGDVSQKSDAATRQIIYDDTLQTLLNKGMDKAEAESEAIFQAMETLNFSRRGNSAIMGWIMGAVPFFNTRIQGLDVMYRSLPEQITGLSRGKQYKSSREGEIKVMNSFLARGGQIAAASLAYTLMSHEDEEYIRASEAERDENWIIGGVKFPTPFEIGFIFKTIPERLTRVFLGDDTLRDAQSAVTRGLVNAFELPLAGPQTIAPVMEVIGNHSYFTGRPVVPQYMELRPPEEQYKYYTSNFARLIGDAFSVSPLKVEHVLKGYGGTMGSYLLATLDSAVKVSKGQPIMMDWRSDEIPLIGSIFQSAESSSGPMQRWNEFYFSVRGVQASINAAKSDPERQKRIIEEYSGVLAAKKQIEKVNTRLNDLRSQRRNVFLSRTIGDDQKRKSMDSIDESINALLAQAESLRKTRPGPIPFFRELN